MKFLYQSISPALQNMNTTQKYLKDSIKKPVLKDFARITS